MKSLETERLLLREWQDKDIAALIEINQDPRVMRYFPHLLSDAQTYALTERFMRHYEQHEFMLYACILKEIDTCIGFIGLNVPDFDEHFTPCVEIGWRLCCNHWGKGYATEGAKKILEHGFEQHDLTEIVSFTTPHNLASRRVMEKIGLAYEKAGDFNHPKIEKDDPLSLHMLYRITKEQYKNLYTNKNYPFKNQSFKNHSFNK